MPCYRCGTRQVDPDRGESPWRRGVRRDRQVLICPSCQSAFDWAADLDKCAVCASVHLVRRLGEVECRDCGSVGQPVLAPGVLAEQIDVGAAVDADRTEGVTGEGLTLAEEVELALSRVLGPSPRPPYAMS
jgi:hypothetical protein